MEIDISLAILLQFKCIQCCPLVAAAASNHLPAWTSLLRYYFAKTRRRFWIMESPCRSHSRGNIMLLAISKVGRFRRILYGR